MFCQDVSWVSQNTGKHECHFIAKINAFLVSYYDKYIVLDKCIIVWNIQNSRYEARLPLTDVCNCDNNWQNGKTYALGHCVCDWAEIL